MASVTLAFPASSFLPMPMALGMSPVCRLTRLGMQTGLHAYARSNLTPEAARASNAGVLSHLLPVQLIMLALCWSVMINRILGLRLALAAGALAAEVFSPIANPAAAAAVMPVNSRLFMFFS